MAISYWYHRKKKLITVSTEGHSLKTDVRGGIVSALKLFFCLFAFKQWSSICC